MLGDLRLDLVDRDAALVLAQDVGKHFLDEGDVDRSPRHHGIGADAVERAFQLADQEVTRRARKSMTGRGMSTPGSASSLATMMLKRSS